MTELEREELRWVKNCIKALKECIIKTEQEKRKYRRRLHALQQDLREMRKQTARHKRDR